MAKILLIEDEKDLQEFYSSALKEAGYDVDTASDGDEGLNKASLGGYGLILLDIMLPKRDGLSILSALKSKPPKVANGPIVVLSNLSHEKALKEAVDLGAKGFLIKTNFTPDELVAKVKSFISPRQ